jgi:hypothetical protein
MSPLLHPLRPDLLTVCRYAGKRPVRSVAPRPRPVGILAELPEARGSS